MARRLIAGLIAILALFLVSCVVLSQEDMPPPPGIPDQGEGMAPAPPATSAGPPVVEPARPREHPKRTTVPPKPPQKPTREEPQRILKTESLAFVAAQEGNDWTMYRGDASHTGYTEEQLAFPLKLAWKHLAGLSPDNPSSPAVADGVVYFCSDRRLYAVNAETGSLRWQYPAQGPLTSVIKSSPAIGDGLVYFGAGDGTLYAVTTDRGALAWCFTTKGSISSSPTLADGVLYVGSDDNSLYALDAQGRGMKWQSGFRTGDDVSCSPAVADGIVYFMSNDMMLYAAHASSGKVKWMVRAGNTLRSIGPVVADNVVYLPVVNVLKAFQAKSGRPKWAVTFPADVTTVPAVASSGIYVACKDGKLYALTSAGKFKWKTPVDIGAEAYGSPIVADDTVIVCANKGIIMAMGTETAEVKWRYVVMPSSLAEGKLYYVNLASSPSVSKGALYVLADDGALNAFRTDMPDSTPPEVASVRPPRDFVMSGQPPVEIAAIVSDLGSGVKPDTISLTLDGEPVEYNLTAERGIVWYKTPRTQPTIPLPDGRHTVTLDLADWAGNKSSVEWSFFVDNTLQPPPRQPAGGTQTAPPPPMLSG